MEKVWKIYATDLKKITTNWAASLIIAALIILPSLYAWFNIKASWDPYGHTKGIAVAVVNLDRGTAINGKKVHAGNEVMKKLKQNKTLGWRFVQEKEATRGVKTGKYYASLTIPENFSEKLASILGDKPEKPVITYTVNEKINAIAPKITGSGASAITQQISSAFVKTVSKTIFTIFNEIGIELERDLPDIENFKAWVFRLEGDIPELNRIIRTADRDITKADAVRKQVEAAMPDVQRLAKRGKTVSGDMARFFGSTGSLLEQTDTVIKTGLEALNAAPAVSNQVSMLADKTEIAATAPKNTMILQNSKQISDAFSDLLRTAAEETGSQHLITVAARFTALSQSFQKQQDLNGKILQQVNNGLLPETLQADLKQEAGRAGAIAGSLLENDGAAIAADLKTFVAQAGQDSAKANKLFQKLEGSLPDIQAILRDTKTGLAIGKAKLKTAETELPAAERKIRELAGKIRAFEKQGNIDRWIQLLKNDAQEESGFLKQPVSLKEEVLYPIKNYGAGMAPFYTVLSFWVGAMLLVSLLSVEHHHGGAYASWQVYFGKLLLFLTIAFFQSAITAAGDLFILHVDVQEKAWFILFGIGIGAVFTVMVYTLVSVFGNVGKALGIVLLVLQISGSGGTFPIQMEPSFFQHIHPLLPFTYGIGLMREAVGGMLMEAVITDIIYLAGFLAIALIFGTAAKKLLSRMTERFTRKGKESGLFE